MDNPKKLQVFCVIIVSPVTVKDVFGTLEGQQKTAGPC